MNCLPTLESIAGRRTAVLGYGREGRSAVAALRSVRPDADITPWVESGELPAHEAGTIAPFDERINGFEVVVRSPGVPVDHPVLKAYRDRGGRVVNPTSIWLAERPDVTVVGVTGSKGKSTTSALLAHLLESSGRRVLLAGNIGVPLLDHLDTDAELAVVELSSYQLTDLEGRIHLGVFTRLFAEHLDWHGGREAYVHAKLNLADRLGGAPLIINARDRELEAATAGIAGLIEGNKPPSVHRIDDRLVHAKRTLFNGDDWKLPGRHNLDNAALALQAAIELGLEPTSAAAHLASFQALPHRLELVAEHGGVCWINDSISTTPHATLAALASAVSRPVILIAGGSVRPADWTQVLDWCRNQPIRALITLPDNGPEIRRQFESAPAMPAMELLEAESLDEAVKLAAGRARPGETVLLSPGAPSFSRFRDFEDRGEQFVRAVKQVL